MPDDRVLSGPAKATSARATPATSTSRGRTTRASREASEVASQECPETRRSRRPEAPSPGDRADEHISAVSLTVTFRGRTSSINLAVGRSGYRDGPRVSPYALWQIGSNTKAFTSVVLLQLEAA